MPFATFADILDRTASLYPSRTAVKFEGVSLSYGQLRERVYALAATLSALGLRQGDRMALLAPNCHQYLELYLVAALAGFVLVPLNTRLTAEELWPILEDCQPTAMVAERDALECFERVRSRLSWAKLFLHIGRPFEGSLDYEGLAGKAVRYAGSRATGDDVNCILYTSGTTGRPKGAMLTNNNWMANNNNVLPEIGVTQDDVTLVMTPLFHCAAIWPVLLSLYLGGTTVMTRRFEVKTTLEVMERERITFCHPVMSQVISLLEHPDAGKYDLSSLRAMQCSMNLPVPAFRRSLQVFGNVVVPGYGLTEAGPMVTLMPRQEMASWESIESSQTEIPRRYGTCGLALPNVEVRLVDEEGRQVPCGEVGEITVKSGSVMKGYWNRPEATAQALRDGWLYTGDMARMDGDGFVYFVDRKSGMIKTGGENVYPKEVEDAIASHPAVLEVAVFGVPDRKWGETVKAVVALRQGASATAEDLVNHCRQRMASYKKPTSIEFVEALPRTSTGKVLKSELRARYAAGKQARLNSWTV